MALAAQEDGGGTGGAADSARSVLLVGASGFIGAAVAAALSRQGVRVRAVTRSRDAASRRVRADDTVQLDLRSATQAEDWLEHLRGVDAVVNCAGALQDSPRDSTAAVHLDAPRALYQACARAGVRRIIHFSAMNVDQGGVTPFSSSKRAIEDFLTATDLDWVILRPSVVVGRAAYGGSALMRGLASLPAVPRTPNAGRISVVQLDDVVETVVRLVASPTPARVAFDLPGPEALTFDEVVARYRSWLGWKPAQPLGGMEWLMALGYRLGDLAGRLGWRPPVRTTAAREIRRGAAGDPAEWTRLTGVAPVSLGQALAREPASVQERWFARLFFVRPLALVVFAAFWIMTGIVSIGPGYDIGVRLMQEGGAGPLSGPTVIAGGVADLVIGFAILWRRTTKPALFAALGLTVFYVFAGTALLPRLWEDPLGPMMKVWPILAFNLLLLAILDER